MCIWGIQIESPQIVLTVFIKFVLYRVNESDKYGMQFL